jgi:hypothetical protein
MKRILGWFAVAAIIAGLPLSHLALGARQTKVAICHVKGNGTGKVISVAEPAVPAHLAHGDCLAVDADVADDGSCACPVAP